ncbi:MAG: hypothetical protein M3230_02445 [Thermoproteota archaeon]|nr:hypothetical protein [Thermoproteota archaeon]
MAQTTVMIITKTTMSEHTSSGSSAQEGALPGRISLTANTRQTLRGFALKKIVKCKRKVGKLLVTESTCRNLITYGILPAEIRSNN